MAGETKAQVPLHPAVAPLSFLLGTWKGQGEGSFPTISSSFHYGEELTFSHSGGKPVIAYAQKTWKLASQENMHAESGYWRPKVDGSIEAVIAQSTGLVEVQKGTYDAEKKMVQLQSELIGNATKLFLWASTRSSFVVWTSCIFFYFGMLLL
ncbi:UPF0678 fatty acid-binding protein-like protein At1g79260 isoform X2 [Amborella trichopoda]|uniref:UPF0678 fatty acid-binding protein-like protein At1g79260 isoform X2 n=1 Tax=Amborella trichopoda TaxID=13333 RepID=UPI0009BE339F|nr:UPF0678 fatty acid-binding protein-like protein At1g79260 isoform X2 [Amborella trichopoda]|eukprot:XP_020517680.1 UPF0678 fatty acid-binding protein-like protein At1g79260 isoform X2 [Amborella trichopoda]